MYRGARALAARHGLRSAGAWHCPMGHGPVSRVLALLIVMKTDTTLRSWLRCIVKGRQIKCRLLLWRLGTKGVSVCDVASACDVMISCIEIDTFSYRKTKPNTVSSSVKRHRHRGPCPAPHYAPTPRGRQRRRAGDSTPRPRGGGQAERTRETLERELRRERLERDLTTLRDFHDHNAFSTNH